MAVVGKDRRHAAVAAEDTTLSAGWARPGVGVGPHADLRPTGTWRKCWLSNVDHYNHARRHEGIEQRRPCKPTDVIPLPTGRVERRDRLGGVLREYGRVAA